MERFQVNYNKNDISRICRLCGVDNPRKHAIIEDAILAEDDDDCSLQKKIEECVGIVVLKNDRMPQTVCTICYDKISDFYEYRLMCKATNLQTRKLLKLPLEDPPVPKKVVAAPSKYELLDEDYKYKPYKNPSKAAKSAKKGKNKQQIPTTTTTTKKNKLLVLPTKEEIKLEDDMPLKRLRRSTVEPDAPLLLLKEPSRREKLRRPAEIVAPPLLSAKEPNKRERQRAVVEFEPLLSVKEPNKRERLRNVEESIPVKSKRSTVEPPPEVIPPLKKIKMEYSCKYCTEEFRTGIQLTGHMAFAHAPTIAKFGCGHCRETFTGIIEYKDHNKWHQDTKTMFKCFHCKLQFRQNLLLVKHLSTNACSIFPTDQLVKQDIQCSRCSRNFITHSLYEWHDCFIKNRAHCPKCGKYFLKKPTLMKHYVLFCTGTWPEKLPDDGPEEISQPSTSTSIDNDGKANKNLSRINNLLSSVNQAFANLSSMTRKKKKDKDKEKEGDPPMVMVSKAHVKQESADFCAEPTMIQEPVEDETIENEIVEQNDMENEAENDNEIENDNDNGNENDNEIENEEPYEDTPAMDDFQGFDDDDDDDDDKDEDYVPPTPVVSIKKEKLNPAYGDRVEEEPVKKSVPASVTPTTPQRVILKIKKEKGLLNASVLENGSESPPVVDIPTEQPVNVPAPAPPVENRIPYAKKRTSPPKKSVARKSTAHGASVYKKPADLMLKIKQEKYDPGYERQEMMAMNVSIKQEPMDYDEVNTQAQEIPVGPPEPEPLPVVAPKKKRAPRAVTAKKTVVPSLPEDEQEPQYDTPAEVGENLPFDAADKSAANVEEGYEEEQPNEIVQQQPIIAFDGTLIKREKPEQPVQVRPSSNPVKAKTAKSSKTASKKLKINPFSLFRSTAAEPEIPAQIPVIAAVTSVAEIAEPEVPLPGISEPTPATESTENENLDNRIENLNSIVVKHEKLDENDEYSMNGVIQNDGLGFSGLQINEVVGGASLLPTEEDVPEGLCDLGEADNFNSSRIGLQINQIIDGSGNVISNNEPNETVTVQESVENSTKSDDAMETESIPDVNEKSEETLVNIPSVEEPSLTTQPVQNLQMVVESVQEPQMVEQPAQEFSSNESSPQQQILEPTPELAGPVTEHNNLQDEMVSNLERQVDTDDTLEDELRALMAEETASQFQTTETTESVQKLLPNPFSMRKLQINHNNQIPEHTVHTSEPVQHTEDSIHPQIDQTQNIGVPSESNGQFEMPFFGSAESQQNSSQMQINDDISNELQALLSEELNMNHMGGTDDDHSVSANFVENSILNQSGLNLVDNSAGTMEATELQQNEL